MFIKLDLGEVVTKIVNMPTHFYFIRRKEDTRTRVSKHSQAKSLNIYGKDRNKILQIKFHYSVSRTPFRHRIN
jgi:hypothetical protein